MNCARNPHCVAKFINQLRSDQYMTLGARMASPGASAWNTAVAAAMRGDRLLLGGIVSRGPLSSQLEFGRHRSPYVADDIAARFPMQCPLIGMAENELAAPVSAVERVAELLFLGQSAEMDDRAPLRQSRCGSCKRPLQRHVRAEIQQRRTARCSREKPVELGTGEFCGGRPIGKAQIVPTRA